MTTINPDGAYGRLDHVIARAKERLGVVLTKVDVMAIEMVLGRVEKCPSCGRVLCDPICPFSELRDGMNLKQTKKHGHQVWDLPWEGGTIRVIFDPKYRHVRTVMTRREVDGGNGFKMGTVVNLKGLRGGK